MTEQAQNVAPEATDTASVEAAASEKTLLLQRARMMNLSVSNNISLEKLREKVAAAMAGETVPPDADSDTTSEATPVENPYKDEVTKDALSADEKAKIEEKNVAADLSGKSQAAAAPVDRPMTVAEQIRADALKLVRVRITNLNPTKKDLPGEIISVSNRYIGTVRKYIPFGELTDDGYHVPQVLLDELVERKFNQIRRIKDKRTGQETTHMRQVREFAIEILDPLTSEELEKLAAAQKAAGSID